MNVFLNLGRLFRLLFWKTTKIIYESLEHFTLRLTIYALEQDTTPRYGKTGT